MAATAVAGWLKRGPVRAAVVILILLEVLAVVLVVRHEQAARRAEAARLASDPRPDVWSQGLLRAAIDRPPIVPAGDAAIGPEEAVIGVEVGGKARAYRLDAFQRPTGHLVNDLVGNVPVSVSYCDQTDCIRVFVDPGGGAALPIEVVGMVNGEMVLKIDGTCYYQKSGRPLAPEDVREVIPYQVLSPSRTTWEEWRQEHPETDVYVGDRRSFPGEEPTR